MKKMVVMAMILGLTHCIAVQVPEDYVGDKYYPSTTQVLSVSPSTSMSWTTLSQPVQVKFNNPMDAASLTVDTAGACADNIQLLNTRTSQCDALTLSSLENRNSILVVNPPANLDPNTDYVITVKGAVTDFRGATLGADQTFPFKSGIPAGDELRVVSVTAAPGTFAGGNQPTSIVIIFSRDIANLEPTLFGSGDCNAIFLLSDNSAPGDCNSLVANLTPTGNGRYAISQKAGPAVASSYTLTISAAAVDTYGIQLGTPYTITLP